MGLNFNLYIERAENELKLARIIFKISHDQKVQLGLFKISNPDSYFSAVISHCYFCIFYCAKAYLAKRNIFIKHPEEHKKTYNEFESFAVLGNIDKELFKIYSEEMIKADELLDIFQCERIKRGKFTYQKLSQANLRPAKQSINNAETFFKSINLILMKK